MTHIKRMLFLAAALVLASFSIHAADHAHCNMKGMKGAMNSTVVSPSLPVTRAKPMLSAVSFKPLQDIQPESLVRHILQSAVRFRANNEGNVGDFCTHQTAVEEWKTWRIRNPHAKSRYGYNKDLENVTALSLSPDGDDSEPEDPMSLGCGCPPEVALAASGCGWFHSQVYGLKRESSLTALSKK